MPEDLVIKTVICTDTLRKLRVSPMKAKVVVNDIRRVQIGKEYDVIAIITNSYGIYYRFKNYSDNNLFNVQGFVDKK